MSVFVALVLASLLLVPGCSTSPGTASKPEALRQHADKTFHELKPQEQSQQAGDSTVSTVVDPPSQPALSVQNGVQVPLAEIGSPDGEMIRATGYGPLAKGLTLCQHSADLAARVELSKLVRVQVTEKSVDRIRERSGKNTEQDIEVVREGIVNEVLSDVRIVDRRIDKEAGTCSSTAVIPRRNLFPTSGTQGQQTQPTGR